MLWCGAVEESWLVRPAFSTSYQLTSDLSSMREASSGRKGCMVPVAKQGKDCSLYHQATCMHCRSLKKAISRSKTYLGLVGYVTNWKKKILTLSRLRHSNDSCIYAPPPLPEGGLLRLSILGNSKIDLSGKTQHEGEKKINSNLVSETIIELLIQ